MQGVCAAGGGGVSREADLSQCAALAAEAAAVAVRNGGVSIEIKLLCEEVR